MGDGWGNGKDKITGKINRAGVGIEKMKRDYHDMGAHETGKNHKRDLRETGKYELWANSGKQRTMPMHGIAGTGGTDAWVRYGTG